MQELAVGLSIISRGSEREKLEWIFSLYDINNRGRITKDELLLVVDSIYELMGGAKHCDPPIFDGQTRVHVEEVFSVGNSHAPVSLLSTAGDGS